MLMKKCVVCGRSIRQDEKCPCRHKKYNEEWRDKKKNEYYHSGAWKRQTAMLKARANGLDEYELCFGRLMQGTTAHHIYPVEERPDLKESIENLLYVSATTHNRLHAEYKRGEKEKRELQERLIAIARGRG